MHRRRGLSLLIVLTMLMSFGSFTAVAYHEGDETHPFANDAFQETWARTDQAVADGQAQNRSWLWGPAPFTPGRMEPYQQSPDGMRQVQYFDKSRMEINNPGADPTSIWYVTNGLLVVELITGRVQVGDSQFETHTPAQVNIVGDPSDTDEALTYADISAWDLMDEPATPVGTTLTMTIDGLGQMGTDDDLAGFGVTAAERLTVPNIDHTVASVFWDYMNVIGAFYEGNPFYATGYPITEAYWTMAMVGGQERTILWQCFERRCLTYTPGNPAAFLVEAGNVGQHYYRWRYADDPEPPPPAETLFMAHLTGDQETPPVTTDAEGWAWMYLEETEGSWELHFSVEMMNIENVTAAHIHRGTVGVSGPVVVPLFTPAGPQNVSGFSGVVHEDDLPEGLTLASLVQEMIDGQLYVNVHTTANPPGEIRGQLMVADDIEFRAEMSGSQEVPANESAATGSVTLVYQHETKSLDCDMTLADIDGLTAAHIHIGEPGVNGGVIAPLFLSAPGSLENIVCDVDESDLMGPLTGMEMEALVWLMLTGGAYVNVHTIDFPPGEIRGQIVVDLLHEQEPPEQEPPYSY